MSKTISNKYELIKVCRSAGLWYVGSFMSEFLDHKELWSNPDTKGQFVAYMFREYSGSDSDLGGTRTRVNCMIRIIESNMVEEALNLVLNANDAKLGCSESKINAKITLNEIKNCDDV